MVARASPRLERGQSRWAWSTGRLSQCDEQAAAQAEGPSAAAFHPRSCGHNGLYARRKEGEQQQQEEDGVLK